MLVEICQIYGRGEEPEMNNIFLRIRLEEKSERVVKTLNRYLMNNNNEIEFESENNIQKKIK